MNRNSIKDFCLEEGCMDKARKVIEEEGVYMGRYMDRGHDFDVYSFGSCTVFVYEKKIRFGGKLPVTILHFSSQLEKKADIKLKEIKQEDNQINKGKVSVRKP